MSKICSFVSVKGGTGKTTTVVNVAATLSREGFNVLAVDANLEGANLSFHLGLSTHNIATIHDVLNGKCSPKEVIYTHPYGINLIMGSVNYKDISSFSGIKKCINSVSRYFDYILIDAPSGFNDLVKEILSFSNEIVVITNPDLPSVVDAYKIIKYSEENNFFVKGVVLNKYFKKSELSKQDVELILNRPILGIIPEDKNIRLSLKERIPIVLYKPKSLSAKGFRNIAYSVSGLNYREPITFWDKLYKLFNRN